MVTSRCLLESGSGEDLCKETIMTGLPSTGVSPQVGDKKDTQTSSHLCWHGDIHHGINSRYTSDIPYGISLAIPNLMTSLTPLASCDYKLLSWE